MTDDAKRRQACRLEPLGRARRADGTEWIPDGRRIWLVFDTSNGDKLTRRYAWWFDSRSAAYSHIKHSKRLKYAATLSRPIPFHAL